MHSHSPRARDTQTHSIPAQRAERDVSELFETSRESLEAATVLNAWEDARTEHLPHYREAEAPKPTLPVMKRFQSTRLATSGRYAAAGRRIRKAQKHIDLGIVNNVALDSATVSEINKIYRKTASTVGVKESFLKRLLTQNRDDRRVRFGLQKPSGQGVLRTTSSTEEASMNYLKPRSTDTIDALSPFVPKLLQRAIYEAHRPTGVDSLSQSFRSDLFTEPSVLKLRGAVLIADVSGFTRLTEQLGRQGHIGIELLTLIINNYLSKAIDIVLRFEGDVIKFAGDSLIVAFYGDPEAGTDVTRETFRDVVLRALQCAEELATKLGRVRTTPNGDVRPVLTSGHPGTLLHAMRTRANSRRSGLGSSIMSNCGSHSSKVAPLTQTDTNLAGISRNGQNANKESRKSGEDKNAAYDSQAPVAEAEKHENRKGLRKKWWRSRHQRRRVLASLLPLFLQGKARIDGMKDVQKQIQSPEQRGSDSTGLSPGTPDKSDHLTFRGSTFWRESFRQKKSSVSFNFNGVLEESEMNLKVFVACGDYCMFRVGGGLEGGNATSPPLPRWEYIIADCPNSPPTYLYGHLCRQPLQQITAIEAYANEGDVILSEEVLAIADYGFEYEVLDGAAKFKGQMVRLRSGQNSVDYRQPHLNALPLRIRKRCAESLRMHVIDNVRQKIELGYLDYISEIRRLSVLFFGFPGLSVPDEDMAPSAVDNVQRVVDTLQKWMRHFEGSFVQFRCDEKGFLAICAFGLAGSHHKDNAARAISAALKIVASAKQLNIDTCVGVTTGDLLCACIGSEYRSEYTLFGNAVNLSARLMCKAKKGMGAVLCDAATKLKAKRKARYHPIEEVRIKGLEEPVVIYLVSPIKQSLGSRTSAQSDALHPMVGSQLVLNGIMKSLHKTLDGKGGSAFFIEGDAGSGKSKLLSEIQVQMHRECHHRVPNVFYSAGDSDSKSVPLYSWRRVFESLFFHDREHGTLNTPSGEDAPIHQKDTLLGRSLALMLPQYNEGLRGFLAAALELELESMPCGDSVHARHSSAPPSRDNRTIVRLTKSCPSLEQLEQRQAYHSTKTQVSFSSSFIGNSRFNSPTSTLSANSNQTLLRGTLDEGRTATRRQTLLEHLLMIWQLFIRNYGSVILILDDIHHFDSLSLELLRLLVTKLNTGMLVVATFRPGQDYSLSLTSVPTEGRASSGQVKLSIEDLLSSPQVRHIALEPLDSTAISEFLNCIAGGTEVSDAVVQYVQEKSSGIPLYVEQMSTYLKEQGLLDTNIFERSLAPDDGLMEFLRENVNIQQMLIEKLDQLKPTTHLTLKVASVIGKNICIALLADVYPFPIPQNVIQDNLEELECTGFLVRDPNSDEAWNFKSMLDRDAVNEITPQSQRRFLHANVASALSSGKYTKVLSTTVAYHWMQSCQGVEALERERLQKAIEWWDRSATEAYNKFAHVEALGLFERAADLAVLLRDMNMKTKRTLKQKLFRLAKRTGIDATSRTAPAKHSTVSSSVQARWERLMAEISLNIAGQAATSDERLAMTNKAMLHALQGLTYLKVPVPDPKTLQFERPMKFNSHYFRLTKKHNSSHREEISSLLQTLLRCSPCFAEYTAAINKVYRCT